MRLIGSTRPARRDAVRRGTAVVAALASVVGTTSCGAGDASRETFCDEAIAAIEAVTAPEHGPRLIEELRAIDPTGLDESDRRSFDGLVAALDDAVDSFTSGRSQSGWTTQYVADLVTRVCDRAPLGGLTVVA